MKDKHTPAPWGLKREEGYCPILLIGKPQKFYKGGKPSQDTILINCNFNQEENANLIAAAPDMLDALELMRNLIDDAEPEDIAFIDRAIAKARGEE